MYILARLAEINGSTNGSARIHQNCPDDDFENYEGKSLFRARLGYSITSSAHPERGKQSREGSDRFRRHECICQTLKQIGRQLTNTAGAPRSLTLAYLYYTPARKLLLTNVLFGLDTAHVQRSRVDFITERASAADAARFFHLTPSSIPSLTRSFTDVLWPTCRKVAARSRGRGKCVGLRISGVVVVVVVLGSIREKRKLGREKDESCFFGWAAREMLSSLDLKITFG